ncbi:MAG: LytTR family DNA-binding domain-containing protein [Eubacteriales bacterium]|nr:LytTR family DNA-binding domain-containing protein [Eubacteriales bacterium]
MRIAIIDDEEIFRIQIEKEIVGFYGLLDTNCYHFSDGDEFIKSLENGAQYDAVFLDIEMAREDGMSTAKNMRNRGIATPIIFITSHVEMAMDGYDVKAFRFLKKPIDENRLRQVLIDLEEECRGERVIILHRDGEELVVPVDDILFVESANTDVRFILNDEEIQNRGKLSDAVEQLMELSNSFCKIHRCCVVNMGNISQFSKDTITMKNGTKLPIARRCQKEFKEKMFQYVKNKGR